MKPWLVGLLRALLILNAAVLGLAGLFMSACGGMVLFGGGFGGGGGSGTTGLVVLGLGCVAVAALSVIWILRASVRALLIAFVLLVALPAVAWLARFRGH